MPTETTPTVPGLTIWVVTEREYGDTETNVVLFASRDAALAWCHEADADLAEELADDGEEPIADMWDIAEAPMAGVEDGLFWRSDCGERMLTAQPVLCNRR